MSKITHNVYEITPLLHATFVLQISSVSCRTCTTCKSRKLLAQVTFARNFQMCHRFNDFQDFVFCPEAKFCTIFRYGDRVTVVKPYVKMATATILYFLCAK